MQKTVIMVIVHVLRVVRSLQVKLTYPISARTNLAFKVLEGFRVFDM